MQYASTILSCHYIYPIFLLFPAGLAIKPVSTVYGPYAALGIGPWKDAGRAKSKVEEMLEDPKYPDKDTPEKYLSDNLRGRIVFNSPQPLVLFFWYLMYNIPDIEVVRVKNKMKNKKMATAADIHINVRVKPHEFEDELAICGELQLLLEHFVLAKDLEHKYYEIRRAETVRALWAPIFG